MDNKKQQANKKRTKYVPVANAYKTNDNKKFWFRLNGKKYLLCKATADDWMRYGYSSDYIILEMIDLPETNENTTNEAAL